MTASVQLGWGELLVLSLNETCRQDEMFNRKPPILNNSDSDSDSDPGSVSFETAVRRVEVLCEIAASLRGLEPGSRGASTGEETAD
jgi:hypothetical protein